ncbi:MAG: hypothetical protein SXA11_00955 [Cyanobacteriota bacterium]|nr:hypothetical protein [Cyanobacteriota bacterium]
MSERVTIPKSQEETASGETQTRMSQLIAAKGQNSHPARNSRL